MSDPIVDARNALLDTYRTSVLEFFAGSLVLFGAAIAIAGIGLEHVDAILPYEAWLILGVAYVLGVACCLLYNALSWAQLSASAITEYLSASDGLNLLKVEDCASLSSKRSSDAIPVLHRLFHRRVLEGRYGTSYWRLRFFSSNYGPALVILGSWSLVGAVVQHWLLGFGQASILYLSLSIGLVLVGVGIRKWLWDFRATERVLKQEDLMQPQIDNKQSSVSQWGAGSSLQGTEPADGTNLSTENAVVPVGIIPIL